MRSIASIAVLLAAVALAGAAEPAARDDRAAEQLGWHLATKCYTFRALTLIETLDITRALGLKYIELNPGQLFSKDQPVKTGPDAAPELRVAIRAALAERGITALGFGVVGLGKDETAARAVFQYAKDLGIGVLISEPAPDAFDLLDRLTTEFDIRVAIHNHPEPSRYWNPQAVLTAVGGHGRLIGACADTGHWARSGLRPLDCLRQLDGRMISAHLKDIDRLGKGARDAVYGTGQADLAGMLAELKRQGFRGLLAMEYEAEASTAQLVADLGRSIAWFDDTARALAK